MSCDDCIYAKDEVCINFDATRDADGNCLAFYDRHDYDIAYQQGIADERPKAFANGYEKGYQQGRADAIEELKPSADVVAYEQGRLDALDHCEKCETEQWDALYKAEMKGRADAIEEIIEYYKPCDDCGACLEYDRDYFKKKCEMDTQISYTELVEDLEQLKEQKNET